MGMFKSHPRGPLRNAYNRKHVYSAVFLNLEVLKGVEYDPRIHAMEDIDFNHRVDRHVSPITGERAVICKWNRFSHVKSSKIIGGGCQNEQASDEVEPGAGRPDSDKDGIEGKRKRLRPPLSLSDSDDDEEEVRNFSCPSALQKKRKRKQAAIEHRNVIDFFSEEDEQEAEAEAEADENEDTEEEEEEQERVEREEDRGEGQDEGESMGFILKDVEDDDKKKIGALKKAGLDEAKHMINVFKVTQDMDGPGLASFYRNLEVATEGALNFSECTYVYKRIGEVLGKRKREGKRRGRHH